ncbi:hypothetical protein CGI17_25405, partial [Vibrio parahaemolyticus]
KREIEKSNNELDVICESAFDVQKTIGEVVTTSSEVMSELLIRQANITEMLSSVSEYAQNELSMVELVATATYRALSQFGRGGSKCFGGRTGNKRNFDCSKGWVGCSGKYGEHFKRN